MNPMCFFVGAKPCFSSAANHADTFELHITVSPLFGDELERFKMLCRTAGLKALQIDFSNLHPVQIMTCSRFFGSLPQAFIEMNRIQDLLELHGFHVSRRKLEAAPWNSHVPQAQAPTNPKEYFEHHAKLELPKGANLARLERIAHQYKAHLSSNAFQRFSDGRQQYFVTRRAYQVSAPQAQAQFDELHKHLQLAGFMVIDSIAEFCVFDSNLELDGSWGL